MFSTYNNERISLFEPLIKNREVFLGGKPWLPDPLKIRFKLGETLTDLKVPYHLGKEDEDLIEAAIISLVSLLKDRYQDSSLEPQKKIQKTFSSVPTAKSEPLMDTTYWLGVFKQDSLEIGLANEILRTTPLIDSAILKKWLDKDGKGRKLLHWTIAILEKTLGEEAGNESGEPTSYMALMALIAAIRKKKERIKEFTIKGSSLERIDVATGFTLFMTIKAATEALFKKIKTSESIYCNPATESILKSAIIPESFLLIPSVLLSSSLNPYGIRNETSQILSTFVPDVSEWPDSSETLIEESLNKLIKNKKSKLEVWAFCLTARLRENIIDYLLQYDLPGTSGHDLFYELYREDRHMHLLDPKTLDSLNTLIIDLTAKYADDTDRVKKLHSCQNLIAVLRSKKTIAKEVKSKSAAEIITDMIKGFVVYKLDSHTAHFTKALDEILLNRRDKYSSDLLLEEFKNGRLYRFSTDRREILRGLTIKQEGQLIIDMKDFTKKTLKLKEIAMADFMKENFYEPILNAAKKYGIDKGLIDKDTGITLNGLPGDAAIFSGGVGNLISLAEGISKIIRDYREKVKEKFLPKLDKHIKTIHEKYLKEQKRIAAEREDFKELIGDDESLLSLDEDVEELINDYSRDELEAAITEEMDAGLFITYGVKAEIMLLEGKDGTGEPPVKVAIGEKINEASRGTSRSQAVMNKLAMLLENEKTKRRNNDLINPFEVHIDKIYSISISKELEDMLERELKSGPDAEKSELINTLMDEYMNDLEKLRQDMPANSLKTLHINTQIYNKGHALSKEALNAYIKEATGKKFFFKKELPIAELSQTIQDKFFFPREVNEFWFSVELTKGAQKVELFTKVGELIFKGFESSPPTEIYEIIDRDGPFFETFISEHFDEWFSDAQKAADVKYEEAMVEETSQPPKESTP